MKNLEIVLVELPNGAKRVFRAPACTFLSKGTKVLVDTSCGEKVGVVVASYQDNAGSTTYKVLSTVLNLSGEFKKVTATFLRELEYEDETNTVDAENLE